MLATLPSLFTDPIGGAKNPRYYLVLNGWGLLATVDISRETENRKVGGKIVISFESNLTHLCTLHFVQKLRQLGHKLADNLGINYFDVHDLSKHRIHPYILSSQGFNMKSSSIHL